MIEYEIELQQEAQRMREVFDKHYVKIFSGFMTEGVKFSLHEAIFEFIWDAMPPKTNTKYLTEKIDYKFLSEVEMMTIDLLDQAVKGKRYDHTSLGENWWLYDWLKDIVAELKEEEGYYVWKDKKTEERKVEWIKFNLEKEITQKSIGRAEDRKKRWQKTDL